MTIEDFKMVQTKVLKKVSSLRKNQIRDVISFKKLFHESSTLHYEHENFEDETRGRNTPNEKNLLFKTHSSFQSFQKLAKILEIIFVQFE